MQAWCISNNETMPENVLKSREKIKELEQQFDQFLKDPASISTQDLKKLQHNYLREVENIQIQMERSFGKKFNSSIEPYLKVHPNHTLATIHHLITTRIMPEGFDIDNDALQNNLRDQQTPFQAKLLGAHLGIVNEPDVVKNLHKDNSNTAEKEGFLDSIKRLFLYGKSRAFTDFVVCGHALVMDICNRGILKVIEHRNAKSEETILSKNGLSDIGIQSPAGKQENALEKTIMSIENKLKILYMERNNIIKIKLGTLNDPKVHAEMHSLLEKKDHEIRDLLEVEKNIKERYGLERHACPKTSFESHKDKFKSFQAERPQEKPNKEIVEEHHSQSTLIPNKV